MRRYRTVEILDNIFWQVMGKEQQSPLVYLIKILHHPYLFSPSYIFSNVMKGNYFIINLSNISKFEETIRFFNVEIQSFVHRHNTKVFVYGQNNLLIKYNLPLKHCKHMYPIITFFKIKYIYI